jgi:hypothetical protein
VNERGFDTTMVALTDPATTRMSLGAPPTGTNSSIS